MLAPIARFLFHNSCFDKAGNVSAVNLDDSIFYLCVKGLHRGLSSCDVYSAPERQLFSIGVPSLGCEIIVTSHYLLPIVEIVTPRLCLSTNPHRLSAKGSYRYQQGSRSIEMEENLVDLWRFILSFLGLHFMSATSMLLPLTAFDR